MNSRRYFPRKLLVLFAAFVLVPSGGALASQMYADSAGDAPGGAPDITAVNVSHKLAGDITFQVTFANRSVLTGDDFVFVSLDSDQNPTTGWWRGEDYWIGVWGDDPGVGWLFRATTADTDDVLMGVLPVTWQNQSMTITFNKSRVGTTKGLDFLVASHTGGAMSSLNTEYVPHYGRLTYALTTEVAEIQLPKPVTKVKAGKVFSIRGATVKLTTDEVFTPDTLVTKAKVGGKALKPLGDGLSWKVPKAAKGKKLVVTMTASYQGMQKVQTLTLRVVK